MPASVGVLHAPGQPCLTALFAEMSPLQSTISLLEAILVAPLVLMDSLFQQLIQTIACHAVLFVLLVQTKQKIALLPARRTTFS
jgi:hypothetical protein